MVSSHAHGLHWALLWTTGILALGGKAFGTESGQRKCGHVECHKTEQGTGGQEEGETPPASFGETLREAKNLVERRRAHGDLGPVNPLLRKNWAQRGKGVTLGHTESQVREGWHLVS